MFTNSPVVDEAIKSRFVVDAFPTRKSNLFTNSDSDTSFGSVQSQSSTPRIHCSESDTSFGSVQSLQTQPHIPHTPIGGASVSYTDEASIDPSTPRTHCSDSDTSFGLVQSLETQPHIPHTQVDTDEAGTVVYPPISHMRSLLEAYIPSDWKYEQVETERVGTTNLWKKANKAEVQAAFSDRFGDCSFGYNKEACTWEPVGGKVVLVTSVTKSPLRRKQDALANLSAEVANLVRVEREAASGARKAKKRLKTFPEILIDSIYHYLRDKCNKHLDANGGSTHCELTQGHATEVIDTMIKHGLSASDIFVDCGSGYGVMASHTAAQAGCRCYAAEYEANRTYSATVAFRMLLDDPDKKMAVEDNTNLEFTPRVAICMLNLFNLQDYNAFDWCYHYDEAFEEELIQKLCLAFRLASRPKWFISFKEGKHPEYRGKIAKWAGVVEVERMSVTKHGSGESSYCILYKRENTNPQPSTRCTRSSCVPKDTTTGETSRATYCNTIIQEARSAGMSKLVRYYSEGGDMALGDNLVDGSTLWKIATPFWSDDKATRVKALKEVEAKAHACISTKRRHSKRCRSSVSTKYSVSVSA